MPGPGARLVLLPAVAAAEVVGEGYQVPAAGAAAGVGAWEVVSGAIGAAEEAGDGVGGVYGKRLRLRR